MRIQSEKGGQGLLNMVEKVSEDIQLLALNIAVAAAKMAQKKDPGLEVHHKLSSLVNQATQAVRQMNKIVRAARTDSIPNSDGGDKNNLDVDPVFIESIESSLNGIISDSEKITRLLYNLKKG